MHHGSTPDHGLLTDHEWKASVFADHSGASGAVSARASSGFAVSTESYNADRIRFASTPCTGNSRVLQDPTALWLRQAIA